MTQPRLVIVPWLLETGPAIAKQALEGYDSMTSFFLQNSRKTDVKPDSL